MDDDELIAAIASGDGDGDDTALRELFSRHAPWLAARLRKALPPDDVEDVLQETFIAVWQNAKTYVRVRGVRGRPGRVHDPRRPHPAGGRWLRRTTPAASRSTVRRISLSVTGVRWLIATDNLPSLLVLLKRFRSPKRGQK